MRVLFTAASIVALAASAQAQQASDYTELDTGDQIVESFNLSIDAIEDMTVVDANGDKVGEVDEVLGTSDGGPMALAVEVGGFLGVGDHNAIIPLDQVKLENDQIQVDMSKDDIQNLPTWDD